MKKLNLRHLRISSLVFASLILTYAYALAADDASSSLPAPPVAKKAPKTTEINGRTMVDNYYWLRDKKNPEVKAYLEAENAYTDAVMKPTEGLQKKLYDEMLSRIKETDIEVPYKEGDYFYYSRTEAGKQYQIHCRKKGGMDAPEEVVLDVNEMAKGQKFMSLGAYSVSDDGNLLAYTTDNTGFRQYTLALKDLRTGKMLPDHAERVGSVVWANDNRTIFYSVEDDTTKRQYQVYRHAAGTSGSDKLAFEEKDEKFDVYAGKTRSKAYILLFSASHTTSEVRYIPAGEPAAEWKVMQPRKQNVEYIPDHNGNFFYIRVNDTGRNFRLVKAPVTDPRSQNWQEVVPHRANVMLDDMAGGKSTLLKQKEVPGGYDRTRYQVEQIYATASDGVKIPISVVHLKGVKLDGKGPLYLTGYGSYGIPYDIGFNSDLFSMIDRGVVVAVAHIRGGGEMGKVWHDDGRMMHKKNTFTDFVASAEYLVAQGYGSKDRLAIEGRSAGGLLMGAVLNMRPDLFHAALVGVPFVDVMNTMLDETLPLTVGEFEEWGNPKEKPAFDYMITYSPYDNIEPKKYPNMLVRTSFNDSQVMYWEPAKYVAKMRAIRTDHNIMILKTNMDPAGHGGASGRYDRLHEKAFDYAYFLTQMGIQE